MFETLRTETQSEHRETEKLLVQKLKSISNNCDYLKLLTTLYGYYKPLEAEILKKVGESIIPDIGKRQRCGSLLADIESIEKKAAGNLPFAATTPFVSASEALGALYVCEGSTLGGEIIAGMIRKNPGLSGSDATRYFAGYGDQNASMWNVFKNQVLSIQSSINEQELINGARNTFISLRQWLTINQN